MPRYGPVTIRLRIRVAVKAPEASSFRGFYVFIPKSMLPSIPVVRYDHRGRYEKTSVPFTD